MEKQPTENEPMHPRDYHINEDAKARWEGIWYVLNRDHRQAWKEKNDSPAEWAMEQEIEWLWEELSQMTTAHLWAKARAEMLETTVAAYRDEAKAAQSALDQLRELIPKP